MINTHVAILDDYKQKIIFNIHEEILFRGYAVYFTSNGSGTFVSPVALFEALGFRILSSIDWSERRVPWDFSIPEPNERD